MSFKYKTFLLLFVILTLSLIIIEAKLVNAQTTQGGTHVQLIVENCNHNLICEINLGENFQGCASDCLPPPPQLPPESQGNNNLKSGGGAYLINATAIPTANDAIIFWQTSIQTRGTLMWGLTPDYELGTIAEINFGTYHEIKLSNLTAGTRYYFKINSVDSNNKNHYGQGQFFTLPNPDKISPSNITNIKIELRPDAKGNYFFINWTNPLDADFHDVHVIRSKDFYVTDPKFGDIVYEGPGNSFEDHSVENNVDYYYSFFVRDFDGNYSSGALARVRLSSNPFIPINQFENVPSIRFNLSDFEIIQKNQSTNEWHHLNILDDVIYGETGQPIIMMISNEKFPTDINYILISIEDSENPSVFNSYFIRSIDNKNSWEADIPAFSKEGKFDFFITTLNSRKEVISQSQGIFDIRNTLGNTHFSIWHFFGMWISLFIKWLKAFLTYFFSFLR